MPHRQALLKALDEYQPINQNDNEQRLRIREFVLSNEDCFKRSLTKGHLTGSAWLVNVEGDQVLLTHHKKLNLWLQLGGHADGQTDLLQVALREAKEESGINFIEPVSENIFDLDVHFIPTYKDEPAHFHYDIRYAFFTTKESKFTVSKESHDLAWVPIHQINHKSIDISILRMAEKWLRFMVDREKSPENSSYLS